MFLVLIYWATLTSFQMRRRRRSALCSEGVGCVTLTKSDAGNESSRSFERGSKLHLPNNVFYGRRLKHDAGPDVGVNG